MHSSQSCGYDGLPLCHVGWIDIADVRAPSPLTVSEVLLILFGKKGRGV
jgi:hypothetical protein